jgi:hypothetical protein
MQKLSFLLPTVISTLIAVSFFSCSGKSKADDVKKYMEESLINSSKVINLATMNIIWELKNKTTDWPTKERAKVWFPKAEQVVSLSKEIYNYLDAAREQLKEKPISAEFLVANLSLYREKILHVDSAIRQEFANYFDFIKMTPGMNSVYGLTTLQNSIKVIENKIISYCDMKCGTTHDGFEVYSAIVGQNSSYLRPGDELEIKAGIGAFSKAAQPKVNINGIEVELGEEGYAFYKTKISKKPGIYKIPVTISFFSQNSGKDEIINTEVKYTVAKECDEQ